MLQYHCHAYHDVQEDYVNSDDERQWVEPKQRCVVSFPLCYYKQQHL